MSKHRAPEIVAPKRRRLIVVLGMAVAVALVGTTAAVSTGTPPSVTVVEADTASAIIKPGTLRLIDVVEDAELLPTTTTETESPASTTETETPTDTRPPAPTTETETPTDTRPPAPTAETETPTETRPPAPTAETETPTTMPGCKAP